MCNTSITIFFENQNSDFVIQYPVKLDQVYIHCMIKCLDLLLWKYLFFSVVYYSVVSIIKSTVDLVPVSESSMHTSTY
jgi:hypothetical protein